MRAYLAVFPARSRPRLWGLHNYVDVNSTSRWGTETMLRLAPGRIWFTETGAIISRAKPTKTADGDRRLMIRTGSRRAVAATERVFTLARTNPRVTRVYIYHWRAGRRHELGLGARLAEGHPARLVRRLRAPGAPRPAARGRGGPVAGLRQAFAGLAAG